MAVLNSYVNGSWFASADEGQPVHDAVTGEEIARVSSSGIDMRAVLEHGRTVGGPALRELTFHQRAALVKALALHLKEHRDDVYALSHRTGATLNDARFDVDGGIGVLLSYASAAKRELPNDTVVVEGTVEQLGKTGAFVGQHILTPLRGVVTQINAFNFPVWGPLEKLAPALIAGMPTVIKPASSTAFVTARMVELLVESGLLPDGAVQLIVGSVGDLLDHLTGQDLVSFTGSASTGQRLRAHPTLVRNSVRFNAEADSLNCSILGPDATPGSREFELYVKGVVAEMTVKAGQKCTAIRRAFVPAEFAGDVVEAVSEQLAKVKVGNPSNPDVRMGALASLEQREEVRRSLKALADVARVAFGDADHVEVLDADAERGAFLSPMLLRADADSVERAEFHAVEAFGPVSTVLPYSSLEQVIDLASRGEGSLAGSVVSADPSFVRSVVLGTAPFHGRLLVLDAEAAPEATPHGAPLPQLVHGGPGRAGGGEELGGMRSVYHHMQRTAVQGSPTMLGAVTGRWVKGSARREDDHPFHKSLVDLRVGDAVTAGPRLVTQQDIDAFTDLTGDSFYAHTDPIAAAANPLFGGIVAHGYLVVSLAAGLFVAPEPGPVLANYGLENLRFVTPVYPGDEVTVTLTAKQITPREGADYGEVRWDTVVTKQDGAVAATYDVLTLVSKQPR